MAISSERDRTGAGAAVEWRREAGLVGYDDAVAAMEARVAAMIGALSADAREA